jgi:hypothetical protein
MKRPLLSRLASGLRTSVAPVFAAACFVACSVAPGSSGAGESTGSANEAEKGDGILHTGLTKEDWKHQHHVGHHHGDWDDARICHPAPLNLCNFFDDEFLGEDGGAACANVTTDSCPDRVDTWDELFVIEFATALDCRFGKWAPPTLTASDVADYLNDLLAFTLQFFGCPIEGTTTKLTFGLIPAPLAGDKFTTADLDALSDMYVAAVQQGLSDSGLPALTDAQLRDMNLKLNRLAHRVPRVRHSNKLTFSNCPAGTPDPDVPDMDDDRTDCDFGDRDHH